MEVNLLQLFYQKYQRELYLYLCALCHNETVAEDLLQETFLKALLSLSDQHANIRAWLYQVARNLYYDQKKHDKFIETTLSQKVADQCDGPLDELLKNERERILYRALSTLDERKCEILELQYFSGLSQKEIGNVLHIKPDYVRVLAHRAKLELRNWMEVHGYDLS